MTNDWPTPEDIQKMREGPTAAALRERVSELETEAARLREHAQHIGKLGAAADHARAEHLRVRQELEAEVARLEAGAVLPRHSTHTLVMIRDSLQHNTSPLPSQVRAVIAALQRVIDGVTTLEESTEVSGLLTDAGLDYIPDLPEEGETNGPE